VFHPRHRLGHVGEDPVALSVDDPHRNLQRRQQARDLGEAFDLQPDARVRERTA
jgi:hypothetical protein